MVYEIKNKYGLNSPKVLSVMLQVPRDKFAPKQYGTVAYEDAPIPIGFGQTMSQPYTVAFMTHLVLGNKEQRTGNKKLKKVLEIGTGSGYHAAVLSKIFKEVYTMEVIPELAEGARETLRRLGYRNIYIKKGSGEWGWPEKSPFDAIVATAGIRSEVPVDLFEQLAPGGILVAPVGKGSDETMTRYRKNSKGALSEEKFGAFRFVPFIESKN